MIESETIMENVDISLDDANVISSIGDDLDENGRIDAGNPNQLPVPQTMNNSPGVAADQQHPMMQQNVDVQYTTNILEFNARDHYNNEFPWKTKEDKSGKMH